MAYGFKRLFLCYNDSMKKFLSILVSLAMVLATPVMSAHALSEAQLDMFAQNNILFYDPDGNGAGNCYGTLMGSTVSEKMLSALLGMGLNEVANQSTM